MTVDSAGSTWTLNTYFIEGPDVWVDGNGYIGNNGGSGVLNITNGATVTGNEILMASGNGSSGIATVNGSTWSNVGHLTVGNYGYGELNIQNGSSVSNFNAYIGRNGDPESGFASGAATVSGSSTWTSSVLRLSRDATLTVESGGTVNVGSTVHIGYSTSCTATITGAGSALYGGKMYLGYMAPGQLDIESGGAVDIAGDITLYSTSLLNLDAGGTFFMNVDDADNSTMSIGASASVDFAGTLKLDLSDVTIDEGDWALITGSGSMTYESTFDLMTSTGMSFTEVSDVWTYTSGLSTWTFSESTGQLSLNTVPEPTTLALLACGLVGLLAYAWRKRK